MGEEKKTSILIVDKNRNSGVVLSSRLSGWGYQCDLAHSVDDAIDRLNNGSVVPDLILAEIMSPDSRVFQLPTLVKERTKWGKLIPIAAHTALSEPSIVRKAISNGFCDYIIRPTERDLLRDKIKNLVVKSPELSHDTFALPLEHQAKVEIDMLVLEFNEYGVKIRSAVPLVVGSLISLNSSVFAELDLKHVKMRVTNCDKESGGRYWALLSFVGLDGQTLRRIRGLVMRKQAKKEQAA